MKRETITVTTVAGSLVNGDDTQRFSIVMDEEGNYGVLANDTELGVTISFRVERAFILQWAAAITETLTKVIN